MKNNFHSYFLFNTVLWIYQLHNVENYVALFSKKMFRTQGIVHMKPKLHLFCSVFTFILLMERQRQEAGPRFRTEFGIKYLRNRLKIRFAGGKPTAAVELKR